jgi:hypothetical protein
MDQSAGMIRVSIREHDCSRRNGGQPTKPVRSTIDHDASAPVLNQECTMPPAVRLILGVGVCAWLVYQLFQVPHDAGSSRTWFYLGLVAVPFTLITLFAVW